MANEKFFAVPNLTQQGVVPVVPWDFVPPTEISKQVRHDKQSRQEFYRNPATAWQFYTGVEGANENQRVSKSNPPRLIYGIVADFDLPVSDEQIEVALRSFKHPPQWVERSLGGNLRLVWTLSRPLLVDSHDFAVFVLQQVKGLLQLEILPGLDEPALTDPMRLYCRGDSWKPTGLPALTDNQVQGFFVRCGADYVFKDANAGLEIPLDIVEKEITAKYPGFNWPGAFEIGSQGPSFWIPESTSAMSAILKKEGLFSFSAHSAKPFYSWVDILGPEFCQSFQTNAVAEATKDVYFDGKQYWLMNTVERRYISMSREVLTNHLRVNCRVSAKPDKSGTSQLDKCLAHIHVFGHVEGGAPILFQPTGLINYAGHKIVNTSSKSKITKPCGEPVEWGKQFPFLSNLLDNLFEPTSQLQPFLAWLQHFYLSGLRQSPRPGQNIFLAGGPGVGKCLGANVPILLHSGEIKLSQHIRLNDVLLGDDGGPRNVLQVNRGFGKMYRIIPKKGEPWTCNGEHILVLKGTNGKRRVEKGQECEVSVAEYLTWSLTKKNAWKLFCSPGWERPRVEHKFDPYIYGLWLGDGCKTHGCLTSADFQIGEIWTNYFEKKGFKVTTTPEKSKAFRYYVASSGQSSKWLQGKRGSNKWMNFIRTSVKNDEKFVLEEYLNASRTQRLKLLAGLLDSDGHLCNGITTFEITQKSEKLSEQICFLARSLGFKVTRRRNHKTCQTGGGGWYFRILISGNTAAIPTILPLKKSASRKQKKDVLVSGFDIEPLDEANYYGVVIDGNRRFLLGDATVTHNTLLNREIVGGLMGGHTDASRFMLGDIAFNSSLFQSAVWSVDDETISDSDQARRKFSSYIKLCAANQSFEYRKKFEHNIMVPWQGRVIVTLNLDEASSRVLPSLEDGIYEKVSFFRCAAKSKVIFPDRDDIKKTLLTELPQFAQWLVSWKTPPELLGEARYGVKSHHEPALIDKAHQAGQSAPFKELLLDYFTRWFGDDESRKEWRGTVTQLVRGLHSDGLNDTVMRSMNLGQINRHLEALSKEGVVECSAVNGDRKTRVWVFPRFEGPQA